MGLGLTGSPPLYHQGASSTLVLFSTQIHRRYGTRGLHSKASRGGTEEDGVRNRSYPLRSRLHTVVWGWARVFRGVSHGDCVMGAYEISDSLTFPPRRRSAAERYRVSVRCFSCQRALSLVHVAHFVNTRIGMVSLMRKACTKHGFDMRKRGVRILRE